MEIPNFVTIEDISLFASKRDLDFINEVDWDDQSFATFSICDTSFAHYEITEDKTLYRKDDDGLLLLDEYTGQINFGTVIILEDKDFEVEFKALFYKGEMRDSSLVKVKELDREVREEAHDKLMQEVEKHQARQNSWWFKLYNFYAKIVSFVFTFFRWVFGAIIKLCWFIEHKIT